MKITIDDAILEKYGLSFQKFLYLYLKFKNLDFDKTCEELLSKNLIVKDLFGNVFCINTPEVKEIMGAFKQTHTVEGPTKEELELATKLMELFPKGSQQGKYSWRGNTLEIALKLHSLRNKYNREFTDEEAIEATKKYVEKFSGDPYMKTLKYFILRVDKQKGEVISELMSFIENKDDINFEDDSWQTRLV